MIIIGGGPCGLSAAIHMQEIGIDALVIEKGNIVNSIYQYPTHQTFSAQAKTGDWRCGFITEITSRSEIRRFLITGKSPNEKSADQRV
ncbi:NAD(P)-binding domain-containing protein [Bacillus licheniformis]|nr:NAD(P)-binding domain-containing protein [Bacillus licheniformis]